MPSSYIEYMISLMSNYNSKNDEYNYDENIENICIEADNLIEENTRESTCRVKLKRILTTLNTCTCCKRHETNRPSLIDVEKGLSLVTYQTLTKHLLVEVTRPT